MKNKKKKRESIRNESKGIVTNTLMHFDIAI